MQIATPRGEPGMVSETASRFARGTVSRSETNHHNEPPHPRAGTAGGVALTTSHNRLISYRRGGQDDDLAVQEVQLASQPIEGAGVADCE